MQRRVKFMSFLSAREIADRARFQAWILDDCSHRLLQEVAGLKGLVVNLAFEPSGQRPRREYEDAANLARSCDVVVEYWFADAGEFTVVSRLLDRLGLAERTGQRHEFRVEETVIADQGFSRCTGVTHGVKYIGRLRFHADLPGSAARRSWAIHGELAVHVFEKLTKYVQNMVVETIGADTPVTHGIPELWFPDIDCFNATAPLGQERIAHDLRHLVASGVRLYTVEHVIEPACTTAAQQAP